MWPTVDRNRGNIARRIEAPCPERSNQLGANLALHGFKGRLKQFNPAQHVLLTGWAAGLTGRLHHVNHDRFFGLTGAFVATDADGQIEADARVIAAGGVNRIRIHLLK